MAAEPTYTDYARIGCSTSFKIGTDINLYSSMHCRNCQGDVLFLLGDDEAAANYIAWGGNIHKKISRNPTVKVKDYSRIQLALKNGVKPDHRLRPGATLTLEDLQILTKEDTNNFLVRSAWYQPEHFMLIKQGDPELWEALLQICVKLGVVQNLPFDDKVVTAICSNPATMSMINDRRFLRKLKKYRSVGLITAGVCQEHIATDPTKLLLEFAISADRPYIQALFGQSAGKRQADYFNILLKEDSLSKWMFRVHESRAVPMFEKLPEEYRLDEDLTWQNYPFFEVYMFVDHARKRVTGGLIMDMKNDEFSTKQQEQFQNNWKKTRHDLDINLEDRPMTMPQIRKYILARVFSEIRAEIQAYHTVKSTEYICQGKFI